LIAKGFVTLAVSTVFGVVLGRMIKKGSEGKVDG